MLGDGHMHGAEDVQAALRPAYATAGKQRRLLDPFLPEEMALATHDQQPLSLRLTEEDLVLREPNRMMVAASHATPLDELTLPLRPALAEAVGVVNVIMGKLLQDEAGSSEEEDDGDSVAAAYLRLEGEAIRGDLARGDAAGSAYDRNFGSHADGDLHPAPTVGDGAHVQPMTRDELALAGMLAVAQAQEEAVAAASQVTLVAHDPQFWSKSMSERPAGYPGGPRGAGIFFQCSGHRVAPTPQDPWRYTSRAQMVSVEQSPSKGSTSSN